MLRVADGEGVEVADGLGETVEPGDCPPACRTRASRSKADVANTTPSRASAACQRMPRVTTRVRLSAEKADHLVPLPHPETAMSPYSSAAQWAPTTVIKAMRKKTTERPMVT